MPPSANTASAASIHLPDPSSAPMPASSFTCSLAHSLICDTVPYCAASMEVIRHRIKPGAVPEGPPARCPTWELRMDRQQQIELLKRLLQHLDSKTTATPPGATTCRSTAIERTPTANGSCCSASGHCSWVSPRNGTVSGALRPTTMPGYRSCWRADVMESCGHFSTFVDTAAPRSRKAVARRAYLSAPITPGPMILPAR